MGKNGFCIRNDFLPEDGLIFVDTCGPMWIPTNNLSKQMDRLADFNIVLSKRGNVWTTELVIEEIKNNIKNLMKPKKRHGKFLPYCGKNSVAVREHRKLIDILRRDYVNTKPQVGPIDYSDIRRFYSRYGIERTDRVLISNATYFDGNNGVLSADHKLNCAYIEGLERFGLSGFVCDSRYASVRRVRDGKIVRD